MDTSSVLNPAYPKLPLKGWWKVKEAVDDNLNVGATMFVNGLVTPSTD